MTGEDSREGQTQTAFSVGNIGFFECNRMCFGLTNAPEERHQEEE